MLEKPERRWEDNTKVVLKEMGCESVEQFGRARGWASVVGVCE